MSVGYMSGGKLVTAATKDDMAAEVSAREEADSSLQEQIDNIEIVPDYRIGSDGTYYVYTADGLKAWAAACESDASTSCVLMNSIDLEGEAWSPVGSSVTYAGKFDGGGNTIRNFTLNTGGTSAGFFSTISGAQIRNMHIVLLESTTSAQYIGGIAGFDSGKSIISGCSVSGKIVVSESNNPYIGGIVGRTGMSTIIIGCVNNCELSVTISSGNVYLGGIAGYVISSVYNCINAASITSNSGCSYIHAGGIVGHIDEGSVLIQGCSNAGNIDINDNSVHAGGIAGMLISEGSTMSICCCSNVAYINVNFVTTLYEGYILGYASSIQSTSTLVRYNTRVIGPELEIGNVSE